MSAGRATTIAILSLSLGCTRSRAVDPPDAADDAATPDAIAAAPSGSASAAPAPDPILGEWERKTEPYAGMRIAIRAGTPLRAVVTLAPPVTAARITPALPRVQLECQKSLWKDGEELVSAIVPAKEGGFTATILVRDWGFTGTCRHADSHAPARLSVDPKTDELEIAVTRGKVATQRWVRVESP